MNNAIANWASDNPEVAAACVAAITSTFIALILRPFTASRLERLKASIEQDAVVHRQSMQKELENLKSQLEERRNAAAARRDYEYDARKRLYAEIEPIRFQIHEALEGAYYRVRSLARSSRHSNLGPEQQSWLATPGYYLRSTIYKMVLPIAFIRLLQSRITFFDLGLDRNIAQQYSLLKLYTHCLTDDFDLAATDPPIEYDPNNPEADTRSRNNSAVYRRQALVLGDLECVADLLISRDNEQICVHQFGDFEKLFEAPKRDDNLSEVISLFRDFSAANKPVLARLLQAQACFAKLILSTYHSSVEASALTSRLEALCSDHTICADLAWNDGAKTDLSPVCRYWKKRLRELGDKLSPK